MRVRMIIMISVYGKSLLHKERNSVSGDVAELVIDLDLTFSKLVWQENILIEYTRHGRGTLANAAPSLDLTSFRLSLTDDKIDGLLSDGKNLLILHIITTVGTMELHLNVVLDLGLRFLTSMLVLESQRRWNIAG